MIYFDVQIIPDLANHSSFKLASVSLLYVSLVLCTFKIKTFDIIKHSSFILHILSPALEAATSPRILVAVIEEWCSERKFWELSELILGVLLLLVDSAKVTYVYTHIHGHTFTSAFIYHLPICHLPALFISVYSEKHEFIPVPLILS